MREELTFGVDKVKFIAPDSPDGVPTTREPHISGFESM